MPTTRRRNLKSRLALYTRRAARYAEDHFRFAEARRLYEECSTLAIGSNTELARARLAAAVNCTFLYDLPAARRHARSALAAARLSRDASVIGGALNEVARLHILAGRHTRALRIFALAMRYHRESGDLAAKGTALCNSATAQQYLGNFEGALSLSRRAARVQHRAKDIAGEAATLGNTAGLLQTLGRPVEAEPLFHRAIELSRKTGNLRSEGYATGNLGEMYHGLGRQEAMQTLERALEIHARAGNREQEAWISTRIAAIHAGANRLDEALALYTRALNALEGTERREWTGGVWSKLVGVFIRLGRNDDAQVARANMLLALRGIETPAAQQYRRDADNLLP